MLDVIEDVRNEFKVKLTDNFEKEIIAFLNTSGGNLYIGISDKGEVVGTNRNIDLLQREIKDRIKDNISPSTLGLFDVVVEELDDKKYIKIIVARGTERPYYLKGMGMTPDSCFIRVGSAVQSMNNELISKEFSSRTKNSLKNIVSPNQDLTFTQLKIYYEEKGFRINNNFLKQLELYTPQGDFNYVAYLLSDNNTISVRFAKYETDTAVNLIENEDYGCCCLIKATQNILDKLRIENKTFTKITYPTRKEIDLFDYNAVREAVVNAIVHNDWSREYAPKFEMFNNRIVISSNGGLQENTTKEEFLSGFTLPRNRELMKVFRDLEYVEQMGTGIIRILQKYDKSCFEFFPNFIRVSFPYNENTFATKKEKVRFNETLSSLQNSIISLIQDEPTITQETLSKLLNTTKRTIQRNIKELIDQGILKRSGSNRQGRWDVKN